MNKKINPNLADASELVELPGIGLKLAERILEARPYLSLDDLQRVQGIGPSNLAQWRDAMTLDSDPDDTDSPDLDLEEKQVEMVVFKKPEDEEPSIMDEVTNNSPEMVEMPVEETESKTISEADQPKKEFKENFTREQVLLIVGGSSLLAFILAVALMLGLLTGLNQGSLRFASPADVNALSLSLDSTNSRLTTQESDLQALRTRVDTLETLDERMTVVEENIVTLTDEINVLTQDVDTLKEEVAVLNTGVEELQTQTAFFTSFFESLRNMFNEFFPAPGGGNE